MPSPPQADPYRFLPPAPAAAASGKAAASSDHLEHNRRGARVPQHASAHNVDVLEVVVQRDDDVASKEEDWSFLLT